VRAATVADPIEELPQRLRRASALVGKQGAWSSAMLKLAFDIVERGERLRTVARHFDIPATSFCDHLYGQILTRKQGRQGVLTVEEESDLEKCILQMQDLGYPLTITQLRLKVAEIVQTRETPFRDGIPGSSWLRWWRCRHLDLVLRSTQGLETNRARVLCPKNVASFYHNFQTVYAKYSYDEHHIWNCDETGAQAGRNGRGTLVFAK